MRILGTALILLITLSSLAHGEITTGQEIPFQNTNVTMSTDVHFNENYCNECHEETPRKGGDPFLRFTDYSVTCRCHGYTPESYTHPVEVTPSAAIQKRIPAEFILEEGRVTCNTCHSISQQCVTDQKVVNSQFLRIFYFQDRTELCFQCHEKPQTERLNPHEQLDRDGQIIEAKCLYCHTFKPDQTQATLKKQRRGAPGTVEFVAELSTLCFRCHFQKTKLHIVTLNHLRKPSAKIRANIRNSEKKLRVILPLDDAGGITCATCHNPHQRGVIPSRSPGARGASEPSRLRVPITESRICKACHNY